MGSGSNTEVQALAFFIGKGLSPAQAAGVVGNLKQESSLSPTSPGGGLAQWGGARLSALQSYSAARGLSWQSTNAQLKFIWQELNTTERASLGPLLAAKTPETAARAFSEHYERPGIPAMSNREQYAREAFQTTKGQGFHVENPIEYAKSLLKGEVPKTGREAIDEGEKAIQKAKQATSAVVSGTEALGKIGGTVINWIENPLTPVKFLGGAVLVYVGVRSLTAGTGAARETGRGVGYALESASVARVATRHVRKVKRPTAKGT